MSYDPNSAEAHLISFIIGNVSNVLVAVVGFFLVRTLKQLDEGLRDLRNQHQELRHGHNEHATRIARLEGFQEGVKVGRAQFTETAHHPAAGVMG